MSVSTCDLVTARITELESALALMTKAFELATANGLTYQYEGWGGRYKTGHKPAAEYREMLLARAAEESGK